MRLRGKILVIPVAEVDWIKAEDNYIRIYSGSSSYLDRETLSGLCDRLDPKKFVRVHRSALINVDRIKEVMVINGEYDFKRNLLKSLRQYAQEYKKTLDWSTNVALEELIYTNFSSYDALNRVVELKAPDSSITRLLYSDANLPDQIHVNIRGDQSAGHVAAVGRPS